MTINWSTADAGDVGSPGRIAGFDWGVASEDTTRAVLSVLDLEGRVLRY